MVVMSIAVLADRGFGLTGGFPALIALSGLTWQLLAALFTHRHVAVPLLAGAVALVAAGFVSYFVDQSNSADGPLLAVVTNYLEGIAFEYPAEIIVGAIGVGIFLTRSMNLICKAALGRAFSQDAHAQTDQSVLRSEGASRFRLSLKRRVIATIDIDKVPGTVISVGERIDAPEQPSAPGARLLGGRIIGPLERLMLTALILLGAQPIIVGLLAAKGVVRFPEIAADGNQGSKAEEFLVGSMVSWAAAGLAAAFLWSLKN
jgi:hypothetical protein